MKNHYKLYAMDNKNKLRYWEIYSRENIIEIEYGVVGGQPIHEQEIVACGLAGRTIAEQVASRVNSRINKKLDSGYVNDIEKARTTKRTNALGFEKPMLAQPHNKIKELNFDTNYIQYKYDGHRCLIKNDGGELVAYSRNGKVIDTIDHIFEDLKERIPEGLTLDGELYIHGIPLQKITSLVKRKQEETALLTYQCYDVMLERSYSERYEIIREIIPNGLRSVYKAYTDFVKGEFNIKPLLKAAREKGYEGLILRPEGHNYEAGKRSKGLIKVKEWFDDEFAVIKITKGVNSQAILHLEINGKPFRVTAPGTNREKVLVAQTPELFLGKSVTVQYANLTTDGIPFHPVAVMWRDKENE